MRTSGAIVIGEPACVYPGSSLDFARPKSAILQLNLCETRMFCSFISRWSRFLSRSARNPSTIWNAKSLATFSGRILLGNLVMNEWRSPNSQKSVTIHSWELLLCVKWSSSSTTCSLLRELCNWISKLKRSCMSECLRKSITFTATDLPVGKSRPKYTVEKAPRPNSEEWLIKYRLFNKVCDMRIPTSS